MSSPPPEPFETTLVPADAPYYDLGTYHRPISTQSRDAQVWFDRGLIWSYGFNHGEAAACFERAIVHDPGCAVLCWGLAYSLGPNYNKSWELFDAADVAETLARTSRAVKKALELVAAPDAKSSPVEKALVNAIQARYPDDKPPEDWAVWNTAYADAMERVYDEFGGGSGNDDDLDLDIAALYADSLMNLTPWALWDIETGEVAKGARSLTSKAVLEKALKDRRSTSHPGVLHLYIHLIEMSTTPELGLGPADHLRGLCPDAGHLEHMPSHLDLLVGEYGRAVEANAAAVRADEKYAATTSDSDFYTFYRAHDYHSLIYAAMFAGQEAVALDMAARLEAAVPERVLRIPSPPMADAAEFFASVRPHILVRFGRWQAIRDLALPRDRDLYCVTTATTHYAKGVACAATGDVAGAEEQQRLFTAALARVPATRTDFPNTCRDELAVAEAMLDGELEYRRGNMEKAFELLERAVRLDDALNYSEPWGWMQPSRHALAALLLEQGQVQRAAALYRADLGLDDNTLPRARQHPNNVWALHGYHECLLALDRPDEAAVVQRSLAKALAAADVTIESSCYCRNVGGQNGRAVDGPSSQKGADDCCSGQAAR